MEIEQTPQPGSLGTAVSRRAAMGFLVTGAGALLAACSSPAPPTPAPTSAPARPTSPPAATATGAPVVAATAAAPTVPAVATLVPAVGATAAAKPKSGGELRVGVDIGITSLEPHFSLSWATS